MNRSINKKFILNNLHFRHSTASYYLGPMKIVPNEVKLELTCMWFWTTHSSVFSFQNGSFEWIINWFKLAKVWTCQQISVDRFNRKSHSLNFLASDYDSIQSKVIKFVWYFDMLDQICSDFLCRVVYSSLYSHNLLVFVSWMKLCCWTHRFYE